MGDDAGLAGAGSGKQQDGTVDGFDAGALLGVQFVK
jgi:hypothetical protein